MRQKFLMLMMLCMAGLLALMQVLMGPPEMAVHFVEHSLGITKQARVVGRADNVHVPVAPPRPQLRAGVVHFLFLTTDALPHAEIWSRFLEGAPSSAFRLWAHCTDRAACKRAKIANALPGLQIVSTVPSERCLDLVSPQAWLLKAALGRGRRVKAEKFVLLSETTLPIKPFSVVHETLLATDESDFCLQTPKRWRSKSLDGVNLLLVKHSQWVVLNRAHAKLFSNDWVPVDNVDAWSLPLKGKKWEGRPDRDRVFVDRKNDRCADEFAVFATLFGFFSEGRYAPEVCPLNTSVSCRTSMELFSQSRCRTLNFFREEGRLQDELRADPDANLVFRGAGHPAEFTRVGMKSLLALRRAPHLFARKFTAKAQLGNFSSVMFGPDESVSPTTTSSSSSSPLSPLSPGWIASLWASQPQDLSSHGALTASEEPNPSGAGVPAEAEATREAGSGVLHFLFLLRGNSLLHAGIWQRFLADAPPGSWTAWVHCPDPDACDRSNITGQLPGLVQIKPVHSKLCTDVVSAEAQLMKAALGALPMPELRTGTEKFVLVDEATLPAKPFTVLRAALVTSPESDFCLREPSEWHSIKANGVRLDLVKHSQWVVLNRDCAKRFVEDWVPVNEEAEWTARLGGKRWASGWSSVMVGPGPHGDRCADEFAVFATVFGLPRTGERPAAQSRCPTLDLSHGLTPLSKSTLADIQADRESEVRRGRPLGREITRLGPTAMRALRTSSFLFVRPVSADLQVSQYQRLVLSSDR